MNFIIITIKFVNNKKKKLTLAVVQYNI